MNAIATHRPRTPVAVRHAVALSRDISGGIVIADNDPLIPIDDCQAIAAEMRAALEPAPADQALKHARLIVAAYGGQKPDDPDAYVRLITMAVAQCPPDLLSRLVDEVTRRHARFLPSKGEVETVVSDLRRRRVGALATAEAHLKAHAKREAARPVSTPEEREATLARMRERCPEVFGLADVVKPIPGTVRGASGRTSGRDDVSDADIPRLRAAALAALHAAS